MSNAPQSCPHPSPRQARSRSRAAVAVAVVSALALVGAVSCTRYGGSLDRPADPVVLDGAALPKLIGSAPTAVVGFAWDGTNWHQVPVQVDQRDWVNPGQILHRSVAGYATLAGGGPFTMLVYTPPPAAPGYQSWPVYTPADSDPNLDANDQVSFLSNDAGVAAGAGVADPAGVDASTRQQVHVTDPLSSKDAYLYLYRSPTLTGGGAGTTGVTYTFSLDSGSYLNTYKMGTASLAPNNVAGANPEHSSVSTAAYTQTYGDRWLNNGLTITADGSSAAPFLERGRIQLIPNYCGRSEDTFDDTISASPYEGAFIANVSGPVRAIRSHIGANSGTYTAVTDLFYPQRADSTVDLRVHQIPGVMAFDDFKTGVTGLTYTDDQNTAVPIDGSPDTIVAAHAAPWQMVSGPTGSLVTANALSSTVSGLELHTYHLDQSSVSPAPCTGDGHAWGQNGTRVTGPAGGMLVCTDPTSCAGAPTFASTRTRYYQSPGLSPAQAATLAAGAAQPLVPVVS